MKFFLALILLASLSAFAARVECISGSSKFVVTSEAPSDLKVTFKGETVEADGILNAEEVDLVAKFPSVGEMTLFAKVGKASPENYVFIQGQRNSVVCR
jgi:hypothetical protein